MSDSSELDANFFNSVPKEPTKYFSVDNASVELNSSEKDVFSILHLNIRRGTGGARLPPIFCKHLFFAVAFKNYELCYLKLN